MNAEQSNVSQTWITNDPWIFEDPPTRYAPRHNKSTCVMSIVLYNGADLSYNRDMKTTIEASVHEPSGRTMYRGGVEWKSTRGRERAHGDWTFDREQAQDDAQEWLATWLG